MSKINIFTGKRGTSIILTIFELVVVMGLIVLVNVKAQSYDQSQAVIQKKIATELALMIDTLAGISGNVLIEYPRDLSGYSLLVASQKVVISKEDLAGVNRYEHNFNLPKNYRAGGDVERQARVCLKKTINLILLGACP